jgi:hypothetical protein
MDYFSVRMWGALHHERLLARQADDRQNDDYYLDEKSPRPRLTPSTLTRQPVLRRLGPVDVDFVLFLCQHFVI